MILMMGVVVVVGNAIMEEEDEGVWDVQLLVYVGIRGCRFLVGTFSAVLL